MLHPPGAPYALDAEELAPDQTVAHDPERPGPLGALGAAGWKATLAVFLGALVVFSLFSGGRALQASRDNHFAYLAVTYDSMIAAALGDEAAQARRADLVPFELERPPPHRNDWATYWEVHTRDGEVFEGIWAGKKRSGELKLLGGEGIVRLDAAQIDRRATRKRTFVSFPPGPAVVMMPFAAIWGYEVNDVALTLLFATLNVALLFVLLTRMSRGGRSGRSRSDNLWLTLLFGMGTCHLWLAVMGQVWFTALIVGVTFTLLYMHFAIDARHPFLAGCALAAAFATRTPLLFTAVFFGFFVFFPGGKPITADRIGWATRKIAWFAVPCLLVGFTLMWMNHVRFDSLTEFGHTYLAEGQLGRIKKHGLFDVAFLGKNLSALFTLTPSFVSEAPYLKISTHGMSIFLTTPAFAYLLRPAARESAADTFWHRALWLTVAACALPGLFYQNTGYEQFGFRFSLDYTPYLMLLLATGRHPITRWFKATILWSVAVNAFGAVTLKRHRAFYVNRFFLD